FVIHYDGVFAGLIGFKANDKQNKRIEIGYWLSETYQKKGIVTQSVKCMCQFAFDELRMNRIQIRCAVGNEPSKKIPQKLGFVFEGIERDGELLTGGVFTDLEVYSKLKKDRLRN
ncbi:MAG: ribosomal-protein-serine acetyltransferase, partial [Ancylomarina sp.]